jgi:DNA-directed RNA polymerase specialized sigma24 family protein
MLVFENSSANDLVQTTRERALVHCHQFDRRRDIVVWAIGIVRNAHMVDRSRSVRMRLVLPVTPDEAFAISFALGDVPRRAVDTQVQIGKPQVQQLQLSGASRQRHQRR